MSTSKDNEYTMKKVDLIKSIGSLHRNIMLNEDRVGIPVIHFNDDQDSFMVEVQVSNAGYSVFCKVNGEISHQLKGRTFGAATTVGKILMLASGSKESAVLDDNAYVMGFFS